MGALAVGVFSIENAPKPNSNSNPNPILVICFCTWVKKRHADRL